MASRAGLQREWKSAAACVCICSARLRWTADSGLAVARTCEAGHEHVSAFRSFKVRVVYGSLRRLDNLHLPTHTSNYVTVFRAQTRMWVMICLHSARILDLLHRCTYTSCYNSVGIYTQKKIRLQSVTLRICLLPELDNISVLR